MKVHLLSSNHDSAQENKWEVPFDPSLREVTVSLSGPAPQIELTDPLGRQQFLLSVLNNRSAKAKVNLYLSCIETVVFCFLGRVVGVDQGLQELLNIPNSARIVNLKFPRPGAWKLKVPLWGMIQKYRLLIML